jgi:hypothetical protein
MNLVKKSYSFKLKLLFVKYLIKIHVFNLKKIFSLHLMLTFLVVEYYFIFLNYNNILNQYKSYKSLSRRSHRYFEFL